MFPPNTLFSKIFYKIRRTWFLYDFAKIYPIFTRFWFVYGLKFWHIPTQNPSATHQVIPAPYTAQKIAKSFEYTRVLLWHKSASIQTCFPIMSHVTMCVQSKTVGYGRVNCKVFVQLLEKTLNELKIILNCALLTN